MVDKFQSGGVHMELQGEEDLLLVDGYGDGGFRLQGVKVAGSVVVLEDGFHPVKATSLLDLAEDDFVSVLAAPNKPEFILIGTGERMNLLPATLRKYLEEKGYPYELMDTGAAARTFNVLRMEDRRVAALLLAVS
ncbi:Mth938-like domain-containing protein [Kordiimonas laminariae]|uniref:Mth938-like domain-containing protein n=1 Tax=Kordiimonas laminariae TaxID=2917717 RepID=UPI001FF4A3EB|nr:Mth938-like domain-containing protein [Kordiimonas laminariae]